MDLFLDPEAGKPLTTQLYEGCSQGKPNIRHQ